MKFLSFGAGVQSSVLLMMSIHGEHERPDHVIFSDTGWEPEGVHRHLMWCKKQCEKAGIPFHIVSNGNIRDDMVASKTAGESYKGRWAAMPIFVSGDGIHGMVRRQCTREYKLSPIIKKQRELLGYKKGQRIPVAEAEVWIGISTDEVRRAHPSRDRWIDNVFPLVDPLKMSRIDCQSWWEKNYPHQPLIKSACIGCPFNSDRSWLEKAEKYPDEFEDACVFDEQIRNAADMKGKCYLHSSMRPLRDIEFGLSQGNLDLEDDLFCAGGCGL